MFLGIMIAMFVWGARSSHANRNATTPVGRVFGSVSKLISWIGLFGAVGRCIEVWS